MIPCPTASAQHLYGSGPIGTTGVNTHKFEPARPMEPQKAETHRHRGRVSRFSQPVDCSYCPAKIRNTSAMKTPMRLRPPGYLESEAAGAGRRLWLASSRLLSRERHYTW